MSTMIRVSEEVKAFINEQPASANDTYDSILRRLLKLPPKEKNGPVKEKVKKAAKKKAKKKVTKKKTKKKVAKNGTRKKSNSPVFKPISS